MLPIVQVSRLPSASSFYAAITQPLDIHYLTQPALLPAPALSSSPSSSSSSGSTLSFSLFCPPNRQCITFGTADSRKPLFQLCPATPSPDKPFRVSYLVLSANSLDEVHAFRAAALRANPSCAAVIGTRASLDSDSATVVAASASLESSEVCARVTDPDGNTMEVAYRPSLYNYSSYYDGDSPSRHHGSDYGDRRVLHWSHSSPDTDLAYGGSTRRGGSRYSSDMPGDYAYYSRDAMSTSHYQSGSGRNSLRRSATEAPGTSYGLSTHNASKGDSRGGVGVVGMLGMAAMGAAAGAALTYSVMSSRSRSQTRSSRDRAYEEATVVPSFRRQATFPEAYPAYAPSRCSGYEGMRGTSTTSRREMRALPEPYEYDDGRSRYSAARSYAGEGSRVRGHSETPRSRTPLLTMGEDSYRSVAGSRRGSVVAPPPPPPSIKRSSTYDHASRVERSDRSERGDYRSELRSERGDRSERGERSSHVSSRSHRTVRASDRGSTRGMPATPPNASRSASVRQSRSGSYISARNVPLPPSGSGSSHGRWDVPEYIRDSDDRDDRDDDPMMFDDCDSVAPSDSISCVGSRRRRHH